MAGGNEFTHRVLMILLRFFIFCSSRREIIGATPAVASFLAKLVIAFISEDGGLDGNDRRAIGLGRNRKSCGVIWNILIQTGTMIASFMCIYYTFLFFLLEREMPTVVFVSYVHNLYISF